MSTHRILLSALALLLLVAVVGCSDSPTAPALDASAIANLISGETVFGHDVVSHTVPDTTAGAGAQTFWWREYTASTPQTSYDFFAADAEVAYPYAVATLTTTYTGTLEIVIRDAGGNFTHTTKALEDVVTQWARFEQQLSSETANRGWVLTAISNIVGGSSPSAVTIDNLSLDAASSQDVAYDAANVTTLYPYADRYTLDIDEQVSVILQCDSDTYDAYLHDAFATGVTRYDMINQDLGFYSDQINTPASLTSAESQRVLVVDVLADGVVDGATPYSAYFWAVPYVVNLVTTN